MRQIVLIAHNIRSSHNIGSMLRTADGLNVKCVYLTGYSPYPLSKHDKRLPHESRSVHRKIQKAALGAESTQNWAHFNNIAELFDHLRRKKFRIVALEQSDKAVPLYTSNPPQKAAIVVGNEVDGLDTQVLSQAHEIVEIPMLGKKESHNVVQAVAMALYHYRFIAKNN